MSLKLQKLPHSLAILALHQLSKLEKINQQRQTIAKQYQKALKLPPSSPGSIYLRFPILVNHPQALIKLAKKHQILLGDWYRPVIAPQGVNLNKVGYQAGSCPQAEAVSQKVVNLPTHPQMSIQDAHKVVKIVKNHVNH
jgi:dTDP-4-amino-4,6-dideoxygalactose transaminase